MSAWATPMRTSPAGWVPSCLSDFSSSIDEVLAAHARGELLLAGALADPVDGAVLLFKGDSPGVPERFAKADPYVVSGLVTGWRIREWTTVAGEGAANPVRPS